jgi:hypothetical protein
MAVQARPPESLGLAFPRPPQAPAAPPGSPDGPALELLGRRIYPVAPPADEAAQLAIDQAVDAAILPHQLHEIDQVLEIARLHELRVEKDSRIAVLERGLVQWRERARIEAEARMASEQLAHERETELIRVLHQQIMVIDSAEQGKQLAHARVQELELTIGELEDRLRRRTWRHWRRGH